MKKMLALVLAAAMAFSMAACGGNQTNSGSTGTSASAGSATAGNAGITVQLGPNPETLDPALNSAVDGGNMLLTAFEGLLIRHRSWYDCRLR